MTERAKRDLNFHSLWGSGSDEVLSGEPDPQGLQVALARSRSEGGAPKRPPRPAGRRRVRP